MEGPPDTPFEGVQIKYLWLFEALNKDLPIIPPIGFLDVVY